MKTKHKEVNFSLKSHTSDSCNEVRSEDIPEGKATLSDDIHEDKHTMNEDIHEDRSILNEDTGKEEESIVKTSACEKSADDTPKEQASDADTSFNSSASEQEERTASEHMVTSSYTPPVTHAPIPLQTPTKAMVKAMTPGFLLAAGASGAPKPPPAAVKPRVPLGSLKSDVYDFDEEDECEVKQPEVVKPLAKKAPAKSKVENKPESSSKSTLAPVKKKRAPKKKDENVNKCKSLKTVKPLSQQKKKDLRLSDSEAHKPAIEPPAPSVDVNKADAPDHVDDLNAEVKEEAKAVERQTLEKPPSRSASPAPTPPPVVEPEHAAFDDNMGPPHAPAPAYTHHDHSPLSGLEEDVTNDARTKVNSAGAVKPELQATQDTSTAATPQEQIPTAEASHSVTSQSLTSQESPLKEPMSTEQQHAAAAASVLDLNMAGGGHTIAHDPLSADSKDSYFDLEHDIDPDEAAKILEESDEREKRERKENEERMRKMSDDIAKDSYRYMTSPAHGVADSLRRSSVEMYPDYRQHSSSDFSHIQSLEGALKETAAPASVYGHAAQRRPSGSYVPDFLGNLATTSAGPPSVSSNYSAHSNSMTQHHQTDLASFGASAAAAAGLPAYPPVSTFMTPVATSATPVTSTSFTDSHSERGGPLAASNLRQDPYKLHDNSTATSTTGSLHSSSYPPRDLFPHYFQDPSLSLPPPLGSQQDPRSLAYPGQESSLQALQRSSADFLQRASAGGLAGMNYPSVTESLARLSQTSSQQPWIGHDERSRGAAAGTSAWPQAAPIVLPQELDSSSSLNRNPFSASRPELSSLEAASKRADSAFPGVTQPAGGASDRYDMASAYMGSGHHFNPAAAAASANYSKSLAPSVNPQKQLEEAYRLSDYRSLSHATPMTDMYSRMAMNPALGLDKYYPYSRATEAMYRAPQLGSNPFMPSTSTAPQMPYADRDYSRHPYAQDSAYGKYLPGSNLTQPLPPALQGASAGDYFPPRPGAPEAYIADPYRRTVIHNMMSRFY